MGKNLGKILIPEISDKDLLELSSRIKAGVCFRIEGNKLVRDNYLMGNLYYIKMPEGIDGLRTIGINRCPQATEPVTRPVRRLDTFETCHTMSSCLNVSVAEVLAQIPKKWIYGKKDERIFEVEDFDPADVVHSEDKSYHKTKVSLYGFKLMR